MGAALFFWSLGAGALFGCALARGWPPIFFGAFSLAILAGAAGGAYIPPCQGPGTAGELCVAGSAALSISTAEFGGIALFLALAGGLAGHHYATKYWPR